MIMSSSEEELPQQPVKYVKRRKRGFCGVQQPINLYSHKVMPTIRKVNQKIFEEMNKRSIEEAPKRVCRKPLLNSSPVPTQDCSITVSDDEEDVKFISELSPVKVTPVTPPPLERISLSRRTQPTRFQKKKTKLLCNVESVLLKTRNDSLNQSMDHDTILTDTPEELRSRITMVKIRLQSHVYKYPLLKTSRFKEIFHQLATEVKSEEKNLLFTLNDQRIDMTDTPESIGLSVVDFIDCVLTDQKMSSENQTEASSLDCINIHFQCKFQKIKKTYCVNKFEPFNDVMQKYATSINHNLKKLRFVFDGEIINGTLSPEDLELENDYCIDVMRTNKS